MSNFDHSLSILGIKYINGGVKWYYSIDKDATTNGRIDKERGLIRFEQKILTAYNGKWEFAFVRENGTFLLEHYYHPSTGTQRLSKSEYIKALGLNNNLFNLYLVPGPKMRARGEHQGENVGLASKEEVHNFWHSELSKINLYKGKELIMEYNNGRFKKIAK